MAVAAHRVVLDTNVLVAALRSRNGASHRVLEQVHRGRLQPQLSVPLYLQYVEVLGRHLPSLVYTADEVADILAYLCGTAGLHVVHFLLRPALVDPGDEMVLEAAVKAQAECIVTYDTRHFAQAGRYGVRILTPLELLQVIGVGR